MTDCKHKYNYIKEVDVPTGRYLVETKEAFAYKKLDEMPIDQNYLREETVKGGLSVCERCGDIQVKVLKITQQSLDKGDK